MAQHGVDWLGFDAVQRCYKGLHARRPCPWGAEEGAGGGDASTHVLSVELWDKDRGTLVSGEVRARTHLSLVAKSLASLLAYLGLPVSVPVDSDLYFGALWLRVALF